MDLKKVQLSITAYTHPKAAVVFALLTNAEQLPVHSSGAHPSRHDVCVHMKCENVLDLLRVAPITVLLQVILEGKDNKSSIKNILFTDQLSFFLNLLLISFLEHIK